MIDLSCGFDLNPALLQVSGLRALGEAIVRRLTTTSGALQDHPDYGYNLSELIGSTVSEGQIRQGIEAQIYQEGEVDSATVDIETTGDLSAQTLTITISIIAGQGPFELTLNVSQLGVEAIIPPELP